MPPSTSGNASRQSRSARPSAEVRGEQRVRPLARQERRRARDADHDRVERLVELVRAQLDRAQQRLGVRDRRRPAERRRDGQLGAQRAAARRGAAASGSEPEDERERRARDALERRGVVRVAAERARELRMVEHERDADQRHALARAPLERDARDASPATRSSRAASTRRPRAAPPRRRRASSAAGPPCRTVSAAVTTTTRSVSTSARLTRSGGPRSLRARRAPDPRRRGRRRGRGSGARSGASRATRARAVEPASSRGRRRAFPGGRPARCPAGRCPAPGSPPAAPTPSTASRRRRRAGRPSCRPGSGTARRALRLPPRTRPAPPLCSAAGSSRKPRSSL